MEEDKYFIILDKLNTENNCIYKCDYEDSFLIRGIARIGEGYICLPKTSVKFIDISNEIDREKTKNAMERFYGIGLEDTFRLFFPELKLKLWQKAYLKYLMRFKKYKL
jgi:hypothetical protein